MNLFLTLLACNACLGNPDSSLTKGENWAILTMLGITAVVLGGFAGMIVYLVRRARRYQAAEEIIEQIPKGLTEVG